MIAFFLKSKYPLFDYELCLTCTYDVIKDALHLTAAFLGPAVAIVFLNDWREQLKVSNNHESIKNIAQTADIISFYLKNIHSDIMYRSTNENTESELKKSKIKIIELNAYLNTKIKELKKYTKGSESYIDDIKVLEKHSKDLDLVVVAVISSYIQVHNDESEKNLKNLFLSSWNTNLDRLKEIQLEWKRLADKFAEVDALSEQT